MPLDIPTLQHQLSVLAANLVSLDATFKQREQEMAQLTQKQAELSAEIVRLNGARAYHNMVVEQINLDLKTATAAVATTTASPTTP